MGSPHERHCGEGISGRRRGRRPEASGGRDVALVVNDGPSDAAAAVFTRNRVQAAPVLWSRQAIADGRLRAVVLNSGGANACTGPAGFADTHATAECVATALDIGAGDVAVCSTGLIGERLPMDALLAGVTRAAGGSGPGRWSKRRGRHSHDGHGGQTGGAGTRRRVDGRRDGEGAGMLAPALATMLSVITTDAAVSADRLDRGATRRGAPDVRAGRCRRVPVHERHRDPAGQRGIRPYRLSRRTSGVMVEGRSARIWPANSSQAAPRTEKAMSISPRLRAASRVASSGITFITRRLTGGGLRQ